tara:strand:- start:563 stop:2281 length:1719 start_codon:yes stop_codon:yes gene_type:complete
MKKLFKSIYLILIIITISISSNVTFAKSAKFKYTKENISNYFSGSVSLDRNYTNRSYKYLSKAQSLKERHDNYNIKFIFSLVLLNKFDDAFSFSKKAWKEEEFFFEADLLLGLEYFIKKDYLNAEKHFKRLNTFSQSNIFFEDFFGNALISWAKAAQNKKIESFKFLEKIPERYEKLKEIQYSFLQCYFDTPNTVTNFQKLIENKESGFSRYSFFLANYLFSKNKDNDAKKFITYGKNVNDSNLLIKQSSSFIVNKNKKRITNFFQCENPVDSMAEFFYVISNMYSTQKQYKLSNFYLNVSLFLNNKFTPNGTLLAENYFYQKQYDNSKKIYTSLKSIGEVYSWHASKSIAVILLKQKGKEQATSYLEKEFNLLTNRNFEHYYELANFYKDNEYYKKSIKYYSLALKGLDKSHPLIPKILDRRGTSYERSGDWDRAEKDLLESLKILPKQAYVLNYLAYSWIEKKINVEKALEMLKEATELKKNDGYIIDSLGWAYYALENYIEAEKYLKRAVQLMPLDPIINDHYADALWMLDKDLQARYFWQYVFNLEDANKELRDNISEKLIFGIKKKL